MIPGFSKAGSAPSPASCPGQHWGTQSLFPHPSLPPSISPTLITPIPDVSQQDISLCLVSSFRQNAPRLNCPTRFPSLWHHPEGAKHEVLQALPSQGSAPALAPGGRRVFGHQGPSSAHPTAKSSSRTTLLLQQPPGFEAELFFQSHTITSSAVPTYKACWACTGPKLLSGLFLPKGSLRMSSANPAFGRVQHNH